MVNKSTKIPLGLSLSNELIQTIDTKRGDISRSRFIQRLLEHCLSNNAKSLVELSAS
jgi:hypothetical protein